ncbi:MAG: type IV secretory system conjugative DNA transfer family protein [Microbacteriaceae bacterium]
MPTGPVWWTGAAWATGTLLALAAGAWRRIDVLASRATLGRRPGQLRGSRPRAWARARDLTELAVRHQEPGRFTLGRLGRTLLASDPESHVALIAPTRSGKTTRYVIPWLLEHNGPAVVTSTRTDVVAATRSWRARKGNVIVWDPFGADSVHWTPLTGCEDWAFALAQAQWLADAAEEGDSDIARFWRGEAARLLAPLLHAGAHAQTPIAHVLSWIDTQNIEEPGNVLTTNRSTAALRQLEGIARLDPRNRGTIFMSAAALLAAYRHPAVQATATDGLTPTDLLDEPNTLYIVASARQQRLLAPLVVAILSSILHAAAERANAAGPLKPTLRVLLDETANIAPIRDLPAHLSQAAGHGVRIATIWQTLAQAHHRYSHAADEILANSTTKLYLGPITDDTTRRNISNLLGEQPTDVISIQADSQRRSHTTNRVWRPKGAPATLQQLADDEALMIAGRLPPAVIRTEPWWSSTKMRLHASAAPAHAARTPTAERSRLSGNDPEGDRSA